jgi:hypothetical protein
MKWNFLYQITAASRTPDYEATAPTSPFSVLCPQLNLLNPPRKKFLGTPLIYVLPIYYLLPYLRSLIIWNRNPVKIQMNSCDSLPKKGDILVNVHLLTYPSGHVTYIHCICRLILLPVVRLHYVPLTLARPGNLFACSPYRCRNSAFGIVTYCGMDGSQF